MNTNTKSLVFWMVLIAVAVFMFATVRSSGPKAPGLTYSQFLREVEEGSIATAKINGGGSNTGRAVVSMKDGRTVRTVLPPDYRDELASMQAKGVNIEIEESDSGSWPSVLINASPFLILLAFWIFMMQRMQAKGQRGPMAPIG